MERENVENILITFDSRRPDLEEFRIVCERLLNQILDSNDLVVHSVTSRVKERDKLKEKIERIGKQYEKFEDVTDIVGLRIITQFEDDVDRIGTVIEREFHVDPNKSIDKRQALDPDRFGYLSLHYICALNQSRSNLTEYKSHKGLLFEIQIRSILQHAWAEIEHDLGYKAGSTIPAPIRRRFSRLAGLLELADAEFTRLREELSSYREQVSEAISKQPTTVTVDDVSLRAFIHSDPICLQLDKDLAELLREKLVERDATKDLVPFLQYVGLNTISEVHDALQLRTHLIFEQLNERQKQAKIDNSPPTGVARGVSLFHLFQVMVAETGDIQKTKQALDHFSIGFPDRRVMYAEQLIALVKKFSE